MCSMMALFLIFAFTPSIARWREAREEEVLMISLERTREGQCRSDKYLKCFKGNDRKTSERQGEAYTGLSKCIDTILNWTEICKRKTATQSQITSQLIPYVIHRCMCSTVAFFLIFAEEDCNPKSNNLTAYTLFHSQVVVSYNGFLSDICRGSCQNQLEPLAVTGTNKCSMSFSKLPIQVQPLPSSFLGSFCCLGRYFPSLMILTRCW